MPRSFGGRSNNSRGRSSSYGSTSKSYGSYSRPYSSNTNSYQSKPQTTHSPSYPIRNSGIFGGSSLGSTMAQGMAFGGGSEIGHQVTRSLLGGQAGGHMVQYQPPMEQIQKTENIPTQDQQHELQKKQNPCLDFNIRFVDCLKSSENDIAKCQNLFDDLKSCEKKFF